MKKVLKIALVALLLMPLMNACKDKNKPENPTNPDEQTNPEPEPQTAEEIYDEWMDIDQTLAMTVSVENLKDVWKKTFEANTEKATKEVTFVWVLDKESADSNYLNLQDDMSFIHYRLYSEEASGVQVDLAEAIDGKWSIDASAKQMTLSYSHSLSPQTFVIVRIETNRILLSYETTNPMSGKDEIVYIGYERQATLPQLPTNPAERLANAWKVTADSARIFVFIPEKEGDSEKGEYVYSETKKGCFPPSCILLFAEPTVENPDIWPMLLSESKDGKTLGSYEWIDQSPSNPIEKFLFLNNHIDGDIEFPEEMRFMPDLTKSEKAFFSGEQFKEVTVESKTQRQRWDYFIHVEKAY